MKIRPETLVKRSNTKRPNCTKPCKNVSVIYIILLIRKSLIFYMLGLVTRHYTVHIPVHHAYIV